MSLYDTVALKQVFSICIEASDTVANDTVKLIILLDYFMENIWNYFAHAVFPRLFFWPGIEARNVHTLLHIHIDPLLYPPYNNFIHQLVCTLSGAVVPAPYQSLSSTVRLAE